jgi:predicted RNA-binding protein (virulence factor B family)
MSVRNAGAYLSSTELFLPVGEQTEILTPGEEIVVFVELDKEGRKVATMRLDRHIDLDTSQLREEEKVSLLVLGETALGYQAIVDGRHVGVLYRSEVFQRLTLGSVVVGYVKKVREDGKLDLILQPFGSKGSGDLGRLILSKLAESGGFLAVTDRTSPETIYELFGVSKKKFKMALGALYRQRQVALSEDGIRRSENKV